MTQEEKAHRYDEAINAAKDALNDGTISNNTIAYLEDIFPELKESRDERIRKALISILKSDFEKDTTIFGISVRQILTWLEKQGGQKSTLPKWKYKKDRTPLLRDSIILNKYGCVAKSPSGAIVSDVWVIDYDELVKLPKEELEK